MNPVAPADGTSLSDLADIIAPPPAPWWPPAPGWYVVAGLVAFGVLVVIWKRYCRYRANAYRREALRILDGLTDPRNDLATACLQLPELVKRTALAAWPREDVAPLSGNDWLTFLDRSGNCRDFSSGAGRWLVDLAYDPSATSRIDPVQRAELMRVVRHWIARHSAPGALPC